MSKRKQENVGMNFTSMYEDKEEVEQELQRKLAHYSNHTEYTLGKPVLERNNGGDIVAINVPYNDDEYAFQQGYNAAGGVPAPVVLDRKDFSLTDVMSQDTCTTVLKKLQSMDLFKCNGRFPSWIESCDAISMLKLDSSSSFNLNRTSGGMKALEQVTMTDCRLTSITVLFKLTGLKLFHYERNLIEDMNDEEEQHRHNQILPGTISIDFLCNDIWVSNKQMTNHNLVCSLESIQLTNTEVDENSLKLLMIGKGLCRLKSIAILRNDEIRCFRGTCCDATGPIVCNPKLKSITVSPGFEKTTESLQLMETFLYCNQNIALFKVLRYDYIHDTVDECILMGTLEDQCAMNQSRAFAATGVSVYGDRIAKEVVEEEHLRLYGHPLEKVKDETVKLNLNLWPLVLARATQLQYPLCNNNDLPDTSLEEERQATVPNDVLYHLFRYRVASDVFFQNPEIVE
jgi:hypothetical protein